MKSVVYDAGVLIAADRNERRAWAEHLVRLEMGLVPLVPATVVAQASRSPKQTQLRRFLRGCEIARFDEADAHRTGALLEKSRTKDIVDASVVATAVRYGTDVVTADTADIRRLVTAARVNVTVFDL